MKDVQFCDVFYMDRMEAEPGDSFSPFLPRDALQRASSFLSTKRRADFLWTRLIVAALAKSRKLDVQLAENPPYSPVIHSDRPLFCSISHTATVVGAALCSRPVAVDLEVMRKDRPIQEISDRCFGKDFLSFFPEKNRLVEFYKAWGVRECAIKMNARFTSDAGKTTIVLSEKEPVRISHWVSQNTSFTLAFAGEATPSSRKLSLGQLKGLLGL